MRGKVLGIAFIIMLIVLPVTTGIAILGDELDHDWYPATVNQPTGDELDHDWYPATIVNPLGDELDHDWYPA